MFTRRTQSTELIGPARVDRRTKDLVKRLKVGDIAVIDHEDIDRVAAEGLIECGVAAVVNAASSLSGRYPNVGPLLIAAAGVPLLDRVGPQVMDLVGEGRSVRIDGDELWLDGAVVGKGTRQTLQSLETLYEASKQSLGGELERFAENTLEYLRRERAFITEPLDLPAFRTEMRGRHALIVVRGPDYKSDLAQLRSYVREIRPVLVAVDGGADALLDFGLKPDMIVGDFDSVSSAALRSGAELVVHAYPGGGAPGAARLDELGVPYVVFEAPGTSEDVAMLLADESGAELIVAVGTHVTMVDFLDKGRRGMASTFLVRLKVGAKLVDAKGVSKLYSAPVRKRDLTFLVLAAMLCFVVIALAVAPRVYLSSAWLILRSQWRSLTH